MLTETTKIVVLGGGYAGMMAALRIAGKIKRRSAAVTLVNGLAQFVERPRLHERATGTKLSPASIAHMLRGTKVRFVQGWVSSIAPTNQTVTVQTATGQQQLAHDYLVYAPGSQVERHSVPGVNEHAYTLDAFGDLTASALAARLAKLAEKPFRAIVVGGGATGIETATQIKGTHPQAEVCLVTQGEAGAFKGPWVQQHIRQALAEQAIPVYEQSRVLAVGPDGVVLDSGRIAADVVVWAGGFVASPLAREAGIQVNRRNQVLVDSCLRSLSHPIIYAVGDAACPVEEPGAPMRMSLFTAVVSGAQAADNIVAETAVYVRGFFVWFLKAALAIERRIPGFLFWNGKKRYARVQREQYLGPWLPEPVLTAGKPELVNPAEQVMLHDSISIAFLTLLESLSPAERAVFLLHEVFDYKFREIGQMLDKSEAACRQLFHRAKKHVVANRPRFEVTPEQHERLLHNFVETIEMGEIETFLALLAEDVMLVPDGGGQRGAAICLMKGREAVAAFILGTRRQSPADLHFEFALLNGQQAILAYTGDRQPFFAVFLYSERGIVHLIHVIAGQKLRGVTERQ